MPTSNDKSIDEIRKEVTSIKHQFQYASAAAVIILIIGVVFYHLVEHLTWVNDVYFCVITLTTVGYGDITPHTDPGKIFTIFYVLAGIGIIGGFANALLRRSVATSELRRAIRAQNASRDS